jgi:formylglycine-generating enzyme required for sulfatase activity/dienelactone hydrolase
MDLGIAKAMSDLTATIDLTSVGISLGTPAYMAPEQAAADPAIDHRADIYALGVVAYEMLTGTPPFVGTPQAVLAAHLTSTPRAVGEVRQEVPPAIARLVMKCLEKDPAGRFQTADELLAEIESLVTPTGTSMAPPEPAAVRTRRRILQVLAGAAALVVGLLGLDRFRDDRWLHRTALPELHRLIGATQYDSAFALALAIKERTSSDSLEALWPTFARKVAVTTTPEGVTVHRASLADTSRWYLVGTTPTDSTWTWNGVGLVRMQKPGFQTEYSLALLPTMTALDSPFAEMVRVPGGNTRAFLVGTDAAQPVRLAPYLFDRYEVTNSQYKAFVDTGGYGDRTYWEYSFSDESGRTIPFDDAMKRFVDRTGRPGPSTWEAGTYPSGHADHPVSGVSWYEAAAFGKYARKALPTIYHWARAANIVSARYVVPFSNLDGNGPLPVGKPRGVSNRGISDLAGNVREWVANDAGRGQRFILGGGWRDPAYGFVDAYAQPPMDRSEINGIRLARYDAADSGNVLATLPIPRAFTDFSRERPVSGAAFAGYLPLFEYDPALLNAVVESSDSTAEDWVMERVTFNAAYGGERMTAWVYLPRGVPPPYQAVVVFPGSGAIGAAPFTGVLPSVMNFVPAAGRALVYPIYQSTHERSDSLRTDLADQSIFWRDHMVMWVKDYRRTLDYLSSRPDIDSTKFAYFGFSWGGYMGGVIPAVEKRIRTSVLYVAGLTMERGRQEVEPINYLPRVTSPVLMLNGRYDFFFPVETAQKPFFDFLGTPAEHKKWIVYEGGHDVPRTDLIRESLAWFDRYLGPVR